MDSAAWAQVRGVEALQDFGKNFIVPYQPKADSFSRSSGSEKHRIAELESEVVSLRSELGEMVKELERIQDGAAGQ